MKKRNISGYNEINYVSDTDRLEMQKYVNRYDKKLRRNNSIISSIAQSIKYVVYTPLTIAANVVSVVFRIGGSITAIGIPYGLYCGYKTIVLLNAGVALEDIKQTTFVCLFLIFPFTAYAISLAFQKLSDYLSYNK